MLTELKLRIHFLLCIVALFLLTNTSKADSELPVLRGVGGDFFSDSSLGYEVNLSDYKDNIVLLFFGYTNCPDVCPLTLGYLNSVFTKLSIEQQQKVKVLFVTVNPEYDTPEHLKKYLETFNKAFIGISANPENLQKIAKLFKVSYEEVNQQIKLPVRYNRSRVEVDQDAVSKVFYHSISIFLLDKQSYQIRTDLLQNCHPLHAKRVARYQPYLYLLIKKVQQYTTRNVFLILIQLAS